MKTLRHIRGITLIELMTTVSTLAVTLTLGVPTFSSIQNGIQHGQAIAEMFSSFTLARSEAARRGVSVTVCASSNGVACDAGNSPNWRNGWIVFTDGNENHSVDTGTDQIIQVTHFENAAFSLSSQSTIAAGVAFRGSGYPNAVGTFRYCDTKKSQDLLLNYIGRMETTDTGSGCS